MATKRFQSSNTLRSQRERERLRLCLNSWTACNFNLFLSLPIQQSACDDHLFREDGIVRLCDKIIRTKLARLGLCAKQRLVENECHTTPHTYTHTHTKPPTRMRTTLDSNIWLSPDCHSPSALPLAFAGSCQGSDGLRPATRKPCLLSNATGYADMCEKRA